MKRIISFTLALMLVFSLAVTAFAAEATEKGSITINSVVKDQTYSIYKLLDLVTYDTDKKAYLYQVNDDWDGFFATTEAQAYIAEDKDTPGYVTWVEATESEKSDEERAAELAKLALAWAKKEGSTIKPTATSEAVAEDATPVVFSNLELGYYLVDSSLGALCGLTTTKTTAIVNEKNGTPGIDKTVEEDDATDNKYGDSNKADMFQTVNFKTTITVQAGAENYVLHDKMGTGLTFSGTDSVKVTVNDGEVTAGENTYSVTASCNDQCTFEITFADSYVQSLTANTQIVVSYTAHLNEKAVIASTGNVNETWLSYGDDSDTAHDTTTTYTYEFDLVKTDEENKLLDGAEFNLKRDNEVLYFNQDNKGYYVVAAATEGATNTLVVTGGKVTVRGLDNGNYSLVETKAPDGYNKLTGTKDFTINGTNLSATIANNTYSEGGVQVVNKTGAVLPETGAMGTMMFITFGMLVVLATGVLLVTKKRMTMIQE